MTSRETGFEQISENESGLRILLRNLLRQKLSIILLQVQEPN